MKVFVVICFGEYSGYSEIMGIFSTMKLAEDFANNQIIPDVSIRIEEHTVEFE